MSESTFVLRMRELHMAREQATSLSEKVRLDEEMAALIRANSRGEPIEPVKAPHDYKQAQTGESA